MFKFFNFKKLADFTKPKFIGNKSNKRKGDNDLTKKIQGQQTNEPAYSNCNDKICNNFKIKIHGNTSPFLYNIINKMKEITYEFYYSGFREILIGFYFFVIAFILLCVYSLSFNNFFFLLLNPMHYYYNIGNKVYMLYPFVWAGWSFILLGALELIIELITAFFYLSADLKVKIYEKSLPIYFIPLIFSFFVSSSWSNIYLYFMSVCYLFTWLIIFTMFLRAHTR